MIFVKCLGERLNQDRGVIISEALLFSKRAGKGKARVFTKPISAFRGRRAPRRAF